MRACCSGVDDGVSLHHHSSASQLILQNVCAMCLYTLVFLYLHLSVHVCMYVCTVCFCHQCVSCLNVLTTIEPEHENVGICVFCMHVCRLIRASDCLSLPDCLT